MDRLNWIPVDSSVLAEIAYHQETLWIRFRNGEIYRYPHLPSETFPACSPPNLMDVSSTPAFVTSFPLSRFTVPPPEPTGATATPAR